MRNIIRLCVGVLYFVSLHLSAASLPKVTGLELDGNQLSWDAQDGATGYNIHRDYEYFDTVRGVQSYTVSEPGKYHVISFNDNGEFGVTRYPEEGGTPYRYVEYTSGQITSLPKVTGLELDGNQLSWDAQDGATGYNIHRDYEYFDTVRDTESYTVTVPGKYHVISFNDNGIFGVTRYPEEGGTPYTYVEYTACEELSGSAAGCNPTIELSDPQYFKDVALKVEFGTSGVGRIKKWRTDIKYFVYGEPGDELAAEVDRVVAELNTLVDIQIMEVDDPDQANYQMFFGSGEDFVSELAPHVEDLIETNYGLFSVYWNSSYEIFTAMMYVDIFRTNSVEAQKHLLREELTQSLGLLNDTYDYPESLFYQGYTFTTEYAPVDLELIQALYSPAMLAGMDEDEVDVMLGLN